MTITGQQQWQQQQWWIVLVWMGAQDTDASQAPGKFLFLFLYILIIFTGIYSTTTTTNHHHYYHLHPQPPPSWWPTTNNDHHHNHHHHKSWQWIWTGAQDASVSWAPGMFFLFLFLSWITFTCIGIYLWITTTTTSITTTWQQCHVTPHTATGTTAHPTLHFNATQQCGSHATIAMSPLCTHHLNATATWHQCHITHHWHHQHQHHSPWPPPQPLLYHPATSLTITMPRNTTKGPDDSITCHWAPSSLNGTSHNPMMVAWTLNKEQRKGSRSRQGLGLEMHIHLKPYVFFLSLFNLLQCTVCFCT